MHQVGDITQWLGTYPVNTCPWVVLQHFLMKERGWERDTRYRYREQKEMQRERERKRENI